MKLRSPAARWGLPIPLSILLTLLWVGLIHLVFLLVSAQVWEGQGEGYAAALWGARVLGRARLPTVIVAVNLLLLLYLWVDYRSRPRRGLRTLVFLAAAALLVYLGWIVWYSWWRWAANPELPAGALLTALPALGA